MESLQGYVFVPVAAVITIIYTWMVSDVAEENRFKEVIKNAILVSVLTSIAVSANSVVQSGNNKIDDFMTGPADI